MHAIMSDEEKQESHSLARNWNIKDPDGPNSWAPYSKYHLDPWLEKLHKTAPTAAVIE